MSSCRCCCNIPATSLSVKFSRSSRFISRCQTRYLLMKPTLLVWRREAKADAAGDALQPMSDHFTSHLAAAPRRLPPLALKSYVQSRRSMRLLKVNPWLSLAHWTSRARESCLRIAEISGTVNLLVDGEETSDKKPMRRDLPLFRRY